MTTTGDSGRVVSDLAGLPPGSVVGGRYRVDRVIGSGGMGTVFEARHLFLNQRVALKVLNRDKAAVREHVARFAREARAAATIESDHIARVLDVGTLETGEPFMVLEYLKGMDLAQLLKQRVDGLPIEEAVGLILETCEALAEAHRRGIVHRDLKPSNLFLTQRADGVSVLKVLDFGISKFLTQVRGQEHQPSQTGQADKSDTNNDEFLTQTASSVGSPQYMSPEQIRDSRRVDIRTDIWALGIVLFRLLTKRHPFSGETTADLCASVLVRPPLSLSEHCKAATEELQQIVERCLEKYPEHRYQDVRELSLALAPFAPQAASSVERIAKIATTTDSSAESRPPPTQAAIDQTADILHTSDILLDAHVEPPPIENSNAHSHSKSISTSVASTLSTDSMAQAAGISRRSRVPFLVVAALLIVLGAVGVVLIVTSRPKGSASSSSESSGSSITAAAPPPETATSALSMPLPSPTTPPPSSVATNPSSSASDSVPSSPSSTSSATHTVHSKTAPPLPPATRAKAATTTTTTTTTPRPALSEIPGYGGRK